MNTLEEKLLQELSEQPSVPRPKSTLDVARERIAERELEAVAPSTGYPKLDACIKGWIPGHLYVLTGETNVGKTASACNFAVRVVEQGKKVMYFALEPDATIMEYLAGIFHRKCWGDITDDDLLLDWPELSLYTKDTHPTLNDLLLTIEQSERQDLIIVDHIGYFTSNPGDSRSKTEQESDAIKRIVSTAKRKQTAIMIIAHPRKPTSTTKKKRILSLHDISGSAAFSQDATDILIISMFPREGNKEYETAVSNYGYISLQKVKAGKSGEAIPIRFVPESPVMLDHEEAGSYDLTKIVGLD